MSILILYPDIQQSLVKQYQQLLRMVNRLAKDKKEGKNRAESEERRAQSKERKS
jgi:hypothetical protein